MRGQNVKRALAMLLSASLLLGGCGKKEAAQQTTAVPQPEQPKADYSYTLTQEQADNYQSAVCYLIKRESETLYRAQSDDCGVTFADGKLDTTFDAKALSVSDKTGEQGYPIVDKVVDGEKTSFVGQLLLVDKEGQYSNWRYLIQMEGQGEPKLVAMCPREEGTQEDLLAGKYTDTPDLSAYQEVFLSVGSYYIPTYGEDGKLLPYSQWEVTDSFSAYSFNPAKDIKIEYVPIVGGDYYLLYEITDKNGNVYCSDLIPYQTEPAAPESYPEPDVSLKWAQGERQLLLLNENGVEVYLSVEKNTWGDSQYALKVKNNTQSTIQCSAADGRANGIIPATIGIWLTVEPGKFVADSSGVSFGVADGCPELETIEKLQFTVEITDKETGNELIEPKHVLVDMTNAWPIDRQGDIYFGLTEPAMDALAKEQVLLENEFVRLTLVGAGRQESSYANDLDMTFKIENLSERSQKVYINGIAVNGAFIWDYAGKVLPAGCVDYITCEVSALDMEALGGGSVASVSLLVETQGQEDWAVRSVHQQWIDVNLEKSGTAAAFEPGETIWEKDGVVIGLRGYDVLRNRWELTMINNSEEDVSLELTEISSGDGLSVTAKACAKQHTVFTVYAPYGEMLTEPYAIDIDVYDFNGDAVLIDGTEEVQLPIN